MAANASQNKLSRLLAATLDLAGRGWRVIPLHDFAAGSCSCGKSDCTSAGKHPRTANGLKDGTVNTATIRPWWARWPSANIGVCTGPESGVWMLGPDGQAGIDALAELMREHSELPRTPQAKSGSGGRHYYFRWPDDGKIGNRKNHRGLPIDVRGAGGYFVAPPSRNKNGVYEWEIHPDACELAKAPAWLLEWVRGDDKRSTLIGKASNGCSIVDRAIAYLAKMPAAISGQGGHDQAMEAARVVAWGFDLGAETAYQILDAHYNRRCQPPWSEKELRHKCEEADTKPFDKQRGWLLNNERRQNTLQSSVRSIGRQKQEDSPPKQPRQIPPYQPFPLAALPDIVRDYVDAAAAAIGCDVALVAIPTLATLAGAIGNSRALLVKRKWIEPPVVWGITIGYSGERKSPAYDAAVNPLLEIQMDLIDEHQEAVAEWNKRALDWKEQSKDERGEKPEPPEEPPCYVTSDATIEAVGELLSSNPRGLLLARDELDAWFQSFTRYKGKAGGTDRPHWLELHRAGTLRLHRLTREQKSLSVRRACCSITGTIQPAILARSLDDEAMAAGLGARFLLAMPPAKKRRWTEAEVSEELSKRYSGLLADLLKLKMADERKRKPHCLGVDGLAKRELIDWYNAWGERMAASEGEQVAALAKLEAYAVRLALIHRVVTLAADGIAETRSISLDSIRAGFTLVEWFAAEAHRVYTILRETADERDRRRLIEWIQERGGRVSVRDLQRANGRRWPTREAAQAELDALVDLEQGAWDTVAHGPSGGHDVQFFNLLPMSDTSDTRSDASDTEEDGLSDTCSDTRSETLAKQAKNERVSEVSDTHADNGKAEEIASKTECRTRVSDRVSDREPGLEG